MPTRDNRLANLRSLFEWEQIRAGSREKPGPKAKAARAISERLPKDGPGKASDIYITQLVRGYRTEGDARDRTPSEALCEALEAVYRLPAGWMSARHDDPLQEIDDFTSGRKRASLARDPEHPGLPWTAADPDPGSLAVRSPDENRLLEAFHWLPDDEQEALLRDLTQRAERYRVFAERLMRRREGQREENSPPLPSNVHAPHFPSTRGRLIPPPSRKHAPAPTKPKSPGKAGGSGGRK